jgi:agarase
VAPPATTQPVSEFALIRGTEGFWRIARDHDGVWWFVSPDGQREFLNTVTTVQPFQLGRDRNGIHYVSADWNGGTTNDGDLKAWAKPTLERVFRAGFKGLGAWCNPVFHQLEVPITRDLNIWSYMVGDARRLYSPEWRETAERVIQRQVEPLRDNIHLVGYFTDNELDWGDSGSGPGLYFNHLPIDNPNRQEVMKVIRGLWSDVSDFNRDWGTEIASFDDLDAWQSLPYHHPTGYKRLFSAWLEHLAGDYFRITTEIIRKHDPNHLILGVRFKGYAPEEVVRASRNYTDAQSLNYYVADGLLDGDMFAMMHRESGQPLMITEYAFHSLDGRSGNRNTVGFAGQVIDQQARAQGYYKYTTRLARVAYIIGADWFQWMDEPPSGRTSDGEDVNFGVVDIDDQKYELLAEAVRRTTPKLNDLHAASHRDPQTDVWRESFATKPVMTVPFLDRPVSLNGELSDWPATARVPGVRRSQAIGQDRSAYPLPRMFVGWRHEGLYLGFEVFDSAIQGAPAKGWWWTRDNVEIWLSTRPVPSDQNTYNIYSHQFFFVPDDFPKETGRAGTVGRWHRQGDGLPGHLIPHPDVQYAARVLPDRYVVEMFIPATALNGWDPVGEPAMAFNFNVKNFEQATEYFWSAPKEVHTQLRPNTWGQLYLQSELTTEAQAKAE